jgi:Tol biopolymer transport system component
MGEVWKATDVRLDRTVALKVLPEDFFEDKERGARFEREAKLLAALNHPNIAAIYSFEEIPGVPGSSARHVLVQELLEGETLRSAASGAKLSTKKAIDWARQIAHGIAAAHEKGIVHRDLKPENIFVTKDGRVKILDFGLARLAHPDEVNNVTNLPTATQPGMVMGTLGYMSPEQVKGLAADSRSDIFSFGAVLYEMLTGNRAFKGASAAETISAILKEDPPDISVTNQNLPAGLERLVSHCLEKNPEQRFHSAHDLAFDLEALSGVSASGLQPALASSAGRKSRLLPAAVAVLIAGTAATAYVFGRRAEDPSRRGGASFQQLTYRQQTIFNARFAPDGQTIVYSAAVQGNTPELFTVRPEFPEARPLGLRGVHLLSVSSRGELALLTGAHYINHNIYQGTLARMPLEGGAPRDVLESVREADWSPDGSSLAVIREVGGKDRLEFPIGKILCETGGYLSDLRFSPRGGRIAFFEHPVRWDDRGQVAVVDLQGKKTVLADGFWGEEGLAWSSDGQEVLFSAGNTSSAFNVLAVTLSGRRRTALESAGGLTIHDVRPDGRWLATRDDELRGMPVLLPGQTIERDLAWLDGSDRPMLSVDGKTILFCEYGGSLGANYAVCLRRTDGSPVVRLGEGTPTDLSPDGKWALAIVPTSPQQLVLYPTGAGEALRLDRGGIESYESAMFFPDGLSVLVSGHEPGHAPRCYVQEITGGKPRAVTSEGMTKGMLSPDARQILVKASGGGLVLYPAGGGDGRPVPGTTPDDVAIRWSRDGGSLLVCRQSEVPLRIERLALPAGKRDSVRTVGPADLSGVISVSSPFLAEDEKSYAYVFTRTISHLFLVEGAR